jgi:hypothetical protein
MAGSLLADLEAAAGNSVGYNQTNANMIGTTTFQSFGTAPAILAAGNVNSNFGLQIGQPNGASPFIGFWGATPIQAPNANTYNTIVGMTGNAGNTANAANMATNGNIGNTAWTMGGIVAALKAAGILQQ